MTAEINSSVFLLAYFCNVSFRMAESVYPSDLSQVSHHNDRCGSTESWSASPVMTLSSRLRPGEAMCCVKSGGWQQVVKKLHQTVSQRCLP